MSYTPDQIDDIAERLDNEINLHLTRALEIETKLKKEYGVPAALLQELFDQSIYAGSKSQKRWVIVMTDHRPLSFVGWIKTRFSK